MTTDEMRLKIKREVKALMLMKEHPSTTPTLKDESKRNYLFVKNNMTILIPKKIINEGLND